MKKFLIKINGCHYVGNGTYSTNPADAKVIEGLINLNSHWKRIYDGMRYRELDVEKIEIVEVDI